MATRSRTSNIPARPGRTISRARKRLAAMSRSGRKRKVLIVVSIPAARASLGVAKATGFPRISSVPDPATARRRYLREGRFSRTVVADECDDLAH